MRWTGTAGLIGLLVFSSVAGASAGTAGGLGTCLWGACARGDGGRAVELRGAAERREGGMRLRGGAAGPAETPASSSAQTAFTKVMWKKGKEPLRTVEVVGSWTKFKQRHALSLNQKTGDWEIIMELPRGEHQLKFVIDGNTWKCSQDMEVRTDSEGNQNNVIYVDHVVRASRPVPATTTATVEKKEREGFIPATDSIDIAKDMVSRLEQEQRIANEKLMKAQAQLIETLKGELSQGVSALDKGKKHVNAYTEKGNKGLANIKSAASNKIGEIKSHMAKIRAILDQKEATAIAAVEDNQNKRILKLEGEIAEYDKVSPLLTDLINEANEAIKRSGNEPTKFVGIAQDLIPKIEKATTKASAIPQPSDDASFEALQLNLLPPS